ncbi:zinc finger protein 654 [Discoglossus pictus]
MAEDESDQESERLGEELEAIAEECLEGYGPTELRSREYCRRFCEVVEEYTARWQVPLPQLQVLQTAICCLTSASVSFPAECEHVQYVLSRLALSLFELLLFFGKDEFYEVPLKEILGSVQECHDLLNRYDNTDLRLVVGVIKDGGPWENPVLQAILKGKSEPQDIVDKYLRSENQFFFELRVRYLIACERIPEAMALITTCLSHPEVSKNLYYHQAYFICLHMTRLTDQLLHEHVLRIDCSDGVKIICNTEKEGKAALALLLSETFLITQLQSGDMYCVWDLIFLWTKLQLKMNHCKQTYIEQCYHMLRIASNVKVIFPFMKAIMDEVGEAGVQLSVELCGCALQLDLHDAPDTKSLIYKTIACLLPTDLEICRICALSVFFLERTIEAYHTIDRLYKCSDEDYNEFTSYVENRVRFELLPILKRGLLFDPEFWNFSMIQQNCASLLGDVAATVLSPLNTLDKVTSTEIAPIIPHAEEPNNLKNLSNGIEEENDSVRFKTRAGSARKHLPMPVPSKIDHNVPRYHCTLCNKEFIGGHIFRHAQAHQKKGCFSCVICARKFRNKVILLKHLKNHIKKIQRHHMATLAAASNDSFQESLDTSDVNSSDTSSLSIENGSSSSSTNKALADVTVVEHEGPVPISLSPIENHVTEDLNPSTDLTDLENCLGLDGVNHVEGNLNKNLPDLVKINGTLCSVRGDPISEDHVLNHQENYKCPAQGCVRIFKKIPSLNKHARKAHPADVNVQQHILKWNKGKCRFCQRKFADSKHFMDHLKRHVYPNVHFCLHLNCNEKFKLATQLTEHMSSHEYFKAQCSFLNCFELFQDLSILYKHEAQHYEQNVCETAAPLTEMEPIDHVQDLLVTHKDLSALCNEYVYTVKKKDTLDLPVPAWKSRKDVAEPKTYTQIEKKLNGDIQNHDGHPLQSSNISDIKENPSRLLETHSENPIIEEAILNGHNAQDLPVEQVTPSNSAHNNEDASMKSLPVSEIGQESLKESAADNEQSPSKPKPGTTATATTTWPFSRPLPSSYLDEQYISMPKRRKTGEELTSAKETVCAQSVENFRCGKCLTNYCSSKALEEHRAQNKCQLYFGFDSDDESAW